MIIRKLIIIQDKMNFDKIFNQLNDNEKCPITNTMVEMEHCTPINNIDIIHGIRYRLLQKGISETDMISQLTKEFIKKYEIQDNTFTINNTYKSMIKRNSRNSKLYKRVLDYLEIDENIITTCYFSSLCAPELFISLPSRNQLAII